MSGMWHIFMFIAVIEDSNKNYYLFHIVWCMSLGWWPNGQKVAVWSSVKYLEQMKIFQIQLIVDWGSMPERGVILVWEVDVIWKVVTRSAEPTMAI